MPLPLVFLFLFPVFPGERSEPGRNLGVMTELALVVPAGRDVDLLLRRWRERTKMISQRGPYKIGQHFGPFILEDYLGSGAFKSVYKARNENPGEVPAVVAIGFPRQQDDDGMAEFTKEFTLLSDSVHPAPLRVHGIARQNEAIGFVGHLRSSPVCTRIKRAQR